MTAPLGATAQDWAAWESLGLTSDLLPVVADPAAQISPNSAMKALGKTPSHYNRDGQAAGLAKWTERQTKPADVARWVADDRLGICLQTRRVRAIDVDIDDPDLAAEVRDIIALTLGELPERTRADSAKFLQLLDMPGDFRKRRILLGDKGAIEFLATGNQCVVSSTHPKGARYEWLAGVPVAVPVVAPDDFEALWAALAARYGTTQTDRAPVSLERPRRAADALPDPVLDHLETEGWTLGSAPDGKVYVRCPLDAQHTSDNGPTQAVWIPAGVGARPEGGFNCMHTSHGHISTSLFRRLVGYDQTAEVSEEFDVIEQPVVNPAALLPGPPPFNSGVAWPELERNKAGIVPTVRNALAALGHPDMCGARIAWDDFKALMLVEWIDEQGEWRAFKDTDYVRLREVLEKRGFRKLGADLVRECVARVAEINTMDSAMTWVRGLQWDGQPRAESFFIDCFGVEDSPYTRAVGRYVWTALAGRAVSPGCKADMVPVLIGAQGLGKTTGVEAICPTEDAFVELSLDIHDDNLARKMRGKLVGEIGELRGLAGKDADAIKQWLSRREEEWTPKYREFTVRFPRRLVLFGTGNKTEFLEDETGNRRWLPMTVGANVDLERIRRERDQLWAEGRTMFCAAGHSVDWREAQDLARVEHAAYHVGDDWTELVAAWLDADAMDEAGGPKRGAQPFKTVDVLVGALGLPASRIDRRTSLRIGKVMHGLGYKMHPISVEGHLQKMWIDKNDPRYPKT